METSWNHTTVLLNEAVKALLSNPDADPGDPAAAESTYVDATFGRGGHSRLILSRLGSQGRLIAFDKDPEAVAEADTIADPRFSIRHQGFRCLLYTSDAADDLLCVDLGGRRIHKKKKKKHID